MVDGGGGAVSSEVQWRAVVRRSVVKYLFNLVSFSTSRSFHRAPAAFFPPFSPFASPKAITFWRELGVLVFDVTSDVTMLSVTHHQVQVHHEHTSDPYPYDGNDIFWDNQCIGLATVINNSSTSF